MPERTALREHAGAQRNWAGNHDYAFARWHEPTTLTALREVVAGSDALRVVGSRHCFNDIADTTGDLVALRGLPTAVEIDAERRVARVTAWSTYGEVAAALHAAGWALPNTASLPHITVGGAIATGSHGSGVANQGLGGPVVAVEYVDAHGDPQRIDRGDADFAGHVVTLGALGVWTHVHLALEPTYDVVQTVRLDLPWTHVLADLDAVLSAAYSVSLFTDLRGDTLGQLWLKARADQAAPRVDLGRAATETTHMLPGADPGPITAQLGVPGPWHERLPHFRSGFTPSRGAEVQSEYLLPRAAAVEAIGRLRRIGPSLGPALQCAEIRAVAADDLWLSPACGTDVVGCHFTWVLDQPLVDAAVTDVEAALLPLGARPHWGKAFHHGADAYPGLADFAALRARVDPGGVFDNAFVRRVLSTVATPVS